MGHSGLVRSNLESTARACTCACKGHRCSSIWKYFSELMWLPNQNWRMQKQLITRPYLFPCGLGKRLGTYHRKVLCNASDHLWFLLKAIGAARPDNSTGEAELKLCAIQQPLEVSFIFFFLQLKEMWNCIIHMTLCSHIIPACNWPKRASPWFQSQECQILPH